MPRSSAGRFPPAQRLFIAVAVFALLVGILLVSKWFSATPWGRWQHERLHWNYFTHTLFIAAPLLCLLLFRRQRAEYGLRITTWRAELKLGLLCGLPLVILPLALELGFGRLEIRPVVREYLFSTILYQCLFAGFGEELFFRGMLQGEWNFAFSRPFQLGRIRFGWALFLTAIVFGAVHWLNPYNPFLDRYELFWPGLFHATLVGLVLGFARERTGGLLCGTLIHIGANIYPVYCVNHPAGGWGLGLSWGITAGFLINSAWSASADFADAEA